MYTLLQRATMNKRDQLLKTWRKYPFIKNKTLSIKDFVRMFADLSTGKKSLKTQEFYVAGRIFKSQSSSGDFFYTIESSGETLELIHTDTVQVEGYLPQEVLETGDQILVQGYWSEVYVEGSEVKVQKIKAHKIDLLAPCLEPYHISNYNLQRSKEWQFFLNQIRKVFHTLDFIEVQTPTLIRAPGTEPHLDVFSTQFQMGQNKETLYFPTSPELHLKKMISLGWQRIYEFKNCFRNGEISEHHQPEFMMLEWYRAYDNLDRIIKDIQGMLNFLKLHWPKPIIGFAPLKVVTVADLFREFYDFNLEPQTTREQLAELCKKHNIEISASDTWDEVFFKIFLEKIEPSLGFEAPTIVRNYPPSQSALARISPEGWADRFEFYWKGLEIANAFHELNDPYEQARRFQEDLKKKKENGKEVTPIDEDFLKSLRAGFPPTAGIALGLDRLFMAITDIKDIRRTRAFPL